MNPEALKRRLLPVEPLPFSHRHLRQAAVLVLLHPGQYIGHEKVLLTRRSRQLRQHAGQVAFPGGVLEPQDPSPLHAALRETYEEVGMNVVPEQVVGRLNSRQTVSGFQVYPYVAWWPETPHCVLQRDEVSAVFHVPLPALAQTGLRVIEGRWQGELRQSVGFAEPWQDIWGVTAKILQELLQRMSLTPDSIHEISSG